MFASSVAVGESAFRDALDVRRGHLLQALRGSADPHLERLLRDVDAALSRLQDGTFGICEACHEPIEADRLLRDPLVRLCSDHPGEAESKRLERDLALARVVQRRLLPSPATVISGWRFHYRYAAAGEVGGDYLDVITGRNGATLLLLGDFAGKGVAASMLAAHLHATFRSLAPMSDDTGELLSRANDLFAESAPGSLYATLLAAELWPDGTANLFNAGHCPPLVRRRSSVEPLAVANNLPLGMFPSSRYTATRVSIGRDETMLLYTDGACDAENVSEIEFGQERLAFAMGAAASASPYEVVETCFDHLLRFESGTPAHDDVTLVSFAPDAGLGAAYCLPGSPADNQ
jgi:serine phosphatase RsbU (regulator of sigma subunit)